MKLWLTARKNLVEIWREPKLMLLIALLPLAFLAILALGYSAPILKTHTVLVDNHGPAEGTLLAEMEAQTYTDGRRVFDLVPSPGADAAETALRDRKAVLLLTIRENGEVVVRGDPLNAHFFRASTRLDTLLYRRAEQMSGLPRRVEIVEAPITSSGPQTEYDLYAPGMIVFALLLLIPQTAMLVAREMRWKTLDRLRLTPLRTWELLGGIGLAQMIAAVVMVLLIFGAALLMGFHSQGSLWLAVVISLAVSFSAIGQGLLVACFIENDSQAINVGSSVTMIQVFLSGSFYQFPAPALFTLLGHRIDLFDIFPATHGFLALQQVLSFGAGFGQISFRLAAALLTSLFYLALGIVVFRRAKG